LSAGWTCKLRQTSTGSTRHKTVAVVHCCTLLTRSQPFCSWDTEQPHQRQDSAPVLQTGTAHNDSWCVDLPVEDAAALCCTPSKQPNTHASKLVVQLCKTQHSTQGNSASTSCPPVLVLCPTKLHPSQQCRSCSTTYLPPLKEPGDCLQPAHCLQDKHHCHYSLPRLRLLQGTPSCCLRCCCGAYYAAGCRCHLQASGPH
jgi:hypothetical protein